jgi:hypothetical protein
MTLTDKDMKRLRHLMRPQWVNGKRVALWNRSGPDDVVAFFAGMDETQRRALAPVFLEWRRQADSDQQQLDLHRVWLGLYATSTLSELSRLRWLAVGSDACRIMADRRPDWLQDWAEHALDQTTSSYTIGDLTEGLVAMVDQGLIQPPQHDNYHIGVAHLLLGNWLSGAGKGASLPDLIRPRLAQVEHAIWRQFEVEGGGEISLANFDKYMSGKIDGKWSTVLKGLADEGLLDRSRLLTASLEALNRGFTQYRAGWFSQFHEVLKPTVEERVERSALYLDLLASSVGPTVSLAIAALEKVQKAGKLEAASLIDNVAPALYASSARTVRSAVKLIKTAVASEPALAAQAVTIAAAGLEHPKTEIQELALGFLETNAAALDDDARSAVTSRLEVVSPLLKSRCVDLCGKQPAPPQQDIALETSDLTALRSAADRLPLDFRTAAGIDDALAFASGQLTRLPAAPFTGMDVPRLDPAGRIAPITGFAEWVDEALIAAEHPCELDRIERVLCAAAPSPATFLKMLPNC